MYINYPENIVNKETCSNPAHFAALEKVPAAARRMGVSISQTYREIKDGRLGPLVKLGKRASAVPAEAVDRWIATRIAAAAQAKGGEL